MASTKNYTINSGLEHVLECQANIYSHFRTCFWVVILFWACLCDSHLCLFGTCKHVVSLYCLLYTWPELYIHTYMYKKTSMWQTLKVNTGGGIIANASLGLSLTGETKEYYHYQLLKKYCQMEMAKNGSATCTQVSNHQFLNCHDKCQNSDCWLICQSATIRKPATAEGKSVSCLSLKHKINQMC